MVFGLDYYRMEDAYCQKGGKTYYDSFEIHDNIRTNFLLDRQR